MLRRWLVALQHSKFATRNFPEQIRACAFNCRGGDLCGCHRLGLFWVTYDTVASAKESERAMSGGALKKAPLPKASEEDAL